MTEILILNDQAACYAELLRERFPAMTFHSAVSEAEALRVCGPTECLFALAHEVPATLVARMPRLRWIGALTTGTDHINTLDLTPEVIVTSLRGIHGPQMAELVFLFMLSLFRDARGMASEQRDRRWERRPQRLLFGRTVVILGVGAISEELAVRCQAFGMRVIGVSRGRLEAQGFQEVVGRDQLASVAGKADALVVLVPYSADTHHLINDVVLGVMKDSAYLINVARGDVVDEAALIRHLQEGRIAGAGLDVFSVEPPPRESPLWDMDNVYMTPRIGGFSDRYVEQSLPPLIANLALFAQGRFDEMTNIVRRTGAPT